MKIHFLLLISAILLFFVSCEIINPSPAPKQNPSTFGYQCYRNKRKPYKLHVIAQSGYDYKDVPAIILKGKWLSDYGFTAGKEISFTCQQGKLIISGASYNNSTNIEN